MTNEEDVGGGWKRVWSHQVASMPRTGWRGLWDYIVHCVTGRPLRLVHTDLVLSCYVKRGDRDEIKLGLYGAQVEAGKADD